VRPTSLYGAQDSLNTSDRVQDQVPFGFEQPAQAFPGDDRVVGNHHPHGISARTVVPPPGGDLASRQPPTPLTRSVRPRTRAPPCPAAEPSMISRAPA